MGRSFKVHFTHLMFAALGKAIKGVCKIDSRMRSLVSELPEGYTVCFNVSGAPSKLVFTCQDSRVVVHNAKNTPLVSDLNIMFKNIELAMPMLVGKRGIQKAYAEHDLVMLGDITNAMVIVDMITLVESYLFTNGRLKKIMDRIPKRQAGKGRLYAFMLLGI